MRTVRDLSVGVSYGGRVSYSPDGSLLAMGDALLDARTGAKRATLPGQSFEFSSDGKQLATAGGDRGQITVVHTSGKASSELRATWDGFSALSVSPSGKLLLSASRLFGWSELQLWDIASQQELLKLGEGTDAAFLRNEAALLVVADGAIRFHAVDGHRLASLFALYGKDAGYAFSGDEPPFVELIGSDPATARAALGCRLGEAMYPFEVCSDSYEAAGIVSKAATGASYQDEP